MKRSKAPASPKDSSASRNASPKSAPLVIEPLEPWLRATLLLRKSGALRIELGDNGVPRVVDFGPPQLQPPRASTSFDGPRSIDTQPEVIDPLDKHLTSVEALRQKIEEHDRLLYAAVE